MEKIYSTKENTKSNKCLMENNQISNNIRDLFRNDRMNKLPMPVAKIG